MQSLYNFDEFICENISREYEALLKKVIFVKISSDVNKLSGDSNPRDLALNNAAANELYISYSTKEDTDKDLQFPSNMPVLYYGGHNKEAKAFLKKFKVNPDNMYNHPDDMELSGSKVDFSKKFATYPWQPKTVFSLTDALNGNLKFPVIAKISDGHSGLGIKIFKTADELREFKQPFEVEGEKRSFDLYSECIDIDREYRTIFLKDKCILVNERIACIKTNKTVKTKDIDEGVDFVYVVSDMKKVPRKFINKLNEIAAEIRKQVKLDLWAIDVATDKTGKIFVLEINSAPGLGSEKLVEVYEAVYEDYYQEKLPKTFKEELNKKFISQCRKELYKNYKKEIAKSPWAIDYATINKEYKFVDYPENKK